MKQPICDTYYMSYSETASWLGFESKMPKKDEKMVQQDRHARGENEVRQYYLPIQQEKN